MPLAPLSSQAVYLDYMSSTPLDICVLEAMLPFYTESFGNPHADHIHGFKAGKAVGNARDQIAKVIGADSEELVFTSGATESNNLALIGLAKPLKQTGKTHLITQQTEHDSVLQCFRYLETQGFNVTYLPVETSGLVAINVLKEAFLPETGLVSIMGVNNEIGVIQPYEALGMAIKKYARHIVFHCDAAQCIGRVSLNVTKAHIDLLSLSSHKTYGPMGVGALYIRKDLHQIIQPQMRGGSQEKGLRSGTVPVPLCVGMGLAFEIAEHMREIENKRLETLRRIFIDGLSASGIPFSINGTMEQRISANLNLCLKGIKSEDLLSILTKVSLSSGSACHAAGVRHSHVITALGIDEAAKDKVLRISFGRQTTEQQVHNALKNLISSIKQIKSST